MVDAQAIVDGVRRDVERSVLRARNGIRVLTGLTRTRVGLTPKDVVWQRDKARLYRYQSDRRTRRRPVVIVFSVMGRSYVLDLMPGSSFVEWMLDRGHDVFLLDFGEPDAADAGNTFETYTDDYTPRAIRAAAATAGSDGVDVLGYCFGGVVATLAVAGNRDLPVATLSLMATPIDFSPMDEGILRVLSDGTLDVETILDDTGNVPADAVLRMFRAQKPTAPISNYATLLERMWDDEFVEGFQAMSMWSRDQIPFPGAAAKQGVDLLLRRNALLDGQLTLGGRVVDLGAVDEPLLVITADHDHLVPPHAATPILDLVGSTDTAQVRVRAGHIGLATGRQAVRTTIPELTHWLLEHE